MHDLDVLRDLAIIVGLAIPIVALAHWFRLPPLVAFLLTGVVIGPSGAGLIPDPEAVSALSEIGVVLLLFAIGLELSLSEVLRWGRSVLVAGGAQAVGMIALVAAAGVAVRWADPAFRFTHAKVILIDGARAAIMTLNLTGSTLRSNRDFAVIVEDPSVVAALTALFASDWERVPPPDFALPLVISPVNARRELQDLIGSARQSLEVYALSLEDDAIADALAAAARRGVRVRMITNPPSGDDGYADERSLVRASGGYIGFLASPDVHAKVVIVDGQRAFVGSQNFTATSLDQNREVGIIVANPDVLRRLLRTFEADWSQVVLEAFSAQMPAAAA